MAAKTKTQITIETDRMFIIRRRRAFIQAWCAVCSEVVRMAPPEDAAGRAGMSSREIYRAVEAGRVHFLETAEGLLLVCLSSLTLVTGKPVLEELGGESAMQSLPQLTGRAGQELCPEYLDPPQAIQALKETTWDIVNPDGSTSRKKSWVLTHEGLDKLLACLDGDRERAASKYEIIRRKLIKYFECRGCFSPEDRTDETINRVARRICEGKEIWSNEPANYFYGVARNVLREYWASPEREFSPVENLPALQHPFQNALEQKQQQAERLNLEQRLASLDHCLQSLSPEDRRIIISYYQGDKSERIKNRKNLASSLGLPPNALRIRVHRIREKLERCVAERLEQSPAR